LPTRLGGLQQRSSRKCERWCDRSDTQPMTPTHPCIITTHTVATASRSRRASVFGQALLVNGKRATAAVMRYGCRRGKVFEGCEPRVRGGRLSGLSSLRALAVGGVRNAANLTSGSGMQQARALTTEQAVEVERNHEDGTRCIGVAADARRERHLGGVSGSGRCQAGRKRGTHKRTKPRRGGCGVSFIPSRSGRFEGEAKV